MQFEHQHTCEMYLVQLSVQAFSAVMTVHYLGCALQYAIQRKHVQAVLCTNNNQVLYKRKCQLEICCMLW